MRIKNEAEMIITVKVMKESVKCGRLPWPPYLTFSILFYPFFFFFSHIFFHFIPFIFCVVGPYLLIFQNGPRGTWPFRPLLNPPLMVMLLGKVQLTCMLASSISPYPLTPWKQILQYIHIRNSASQVWYIGVRCYGGVFAGKIIMLSAICLEYITERDQIFLLSWDHEDRLLVGTPLDIITNTRVYERFYKALRFDIQPSRDCTPSR